MENCIDILLHGEGKEQPKPPMDENKPVAFMETDFAKRMNKKLWEKYGKPPPDAWEEWISLMPDADDYVYSSEYYFAKQQWFREMPR
jgi:hypothetical protein